MQHVAVIVSLLWIALPVVAQKADTAAGKREESLSLRTGPLQPEFPLQIAGAAILSDTALKVLLVNLTSRRVEQVTVGIMLEDKTSPEPVTRIGKVCNSSVSPGRFLLVKGANTGFDGADAYFRGKGITQKAVAVGITHVRMAGGIEWNLPLEAKGRFEEGEGDKDLERKIEALLRKAFGRHSVELFFGPFLEDKVGICRE
jgi:hypothetical protein